MNQFNYIVLTILSTGVFQLFPPNSRNCFGLQALYEYAAGWSVQVLLLQKKFIILEILRRSVERELDPFPRPGLQLCRNIVALVSRWRHCVFYN